MAALISGSSEESTLSAVGVAPDGMYLGTAPNAAAAASEVTAPGGGQFGIAIGPLIGCLLVGSGVRPRFRADVIRTGGGWIGSVILYGKRASYTGRGSIAVANPGGLTLGCLSP